MPRALALLALALPLLAQAARLQGVVTHVTDGDTIWVRPTAAAEALPIRLDGIDAPEICQAFGPEARDALTALVLRREVIVAAKTRDKYHRLVARVSVKGEDVGASMVRRGLAWSYRLRGHEGPYRELESAARAARLGLWQGAHPLEPREFRQRHGSCH
jgi:endonuclease YncB( thermonuclease family)